MQIQFPILFTLILFIHFKYCAKLLKPISDCWDIFWLLISLTFEASYICVLYPDLVPLATCLIENDFVLSQNKTHVKWTGIEKDICEWNNIIEKLEDLFVLESFLNMGHYDNMGANVSKQTRPTLSIRGSHLIILLSSIYLQKFDSQKDSFPIIVAKQNLL